jgi:hypothetical protein
MTINSTWFEKIQCVTEENDDGSLNVIFSWDENDEDLQLWNELGEEKQKEWVLTALESAIKTASLLDKELDSEEQS